VVRGVTYHRPRRTKKKRDSSFDDEEREDPHNDKINVCERDLRDSVSIKKKQKHNETASSSKCNDGKENNNASNKRVSRSTRSTRSTNKSSTHSTTSNSSTEVAVDRNSPDSSASKPVPTISFQPKSTDNWYKQKLSAVKLVALVGFEEDEQHAVEVILKYKGKNEGLLSLKAGLEGALETFQKYVDSGCTNAPCRVSVENYQEQMGTILERIDGVKANMGDLAQPGISLSTAIMHYATEAERKFEQPTKPHLRNRMDNSSPCPSAVQKSAINMTIYATTGIYTKPEDNPEVVLMDRVCWCCDKGKQKEIDDQCVQLLNNAGMADYFVANDVSIAAAVSVFIIPTFIFNIAQIHHNTKEPVSIHPVGNPAAKMFQRTDNEWGPTLSNAYVHFCGMMNHPDSILDAKKKLPELNCVNSDFCIAEWSKPLLQDRLLRLGFGADCIQCSFAWKLNWGNLSDEERRLIQESMPS
jgi:hypothetical protein